MAGSASDRLITVIGGSGFIGSQLVRSLARRGYRVRVACRRPDLAGHVQPLGTPGQIMPVQVNLRYPASLAAACAGAYAVVNLASVLAPGGSQTFEALNVFGADAAARAARAAGADLFIQMSAIGADPEGESDYARTKAEGEARARAAFPGAMIIRPSVVFGPGDGFFNRFAGMARVSPVLPLIGADTRFQPVFVGDVAEAIATLIDRGMADGRTYELGGPEVESFRSLLERMLAVIQRKRLLLPVPWGAARIMGTVLGLLPKPFLTADQVKLLKRDNVVSSQAMADARDLRGLGISPRTMASQLPSYLYRYRKAGQFTAPSVTPE